MISVGDRLMSAASGEGRSGVGEERGTSTLLATAATGWNRMGRP